MAAVRMSVAYLWWLVGGIFGWHHLYLGRYLHAFTWLTTGGGCLLGWLWDIFQIPSYCAEANGIGETLIKNSTLKWKHARCSTIRFVGSIAFGSWLGLLSLFAVPIEAWESMVAGSIAHVVALVSFSSIVTAFGTFQDVLQFRQLSTIISYRSPVLI